MVLKVVYLVKGTLNVQGIPKLTNIMLVKYLKANLISISQLCDDSHNASFNKEECSVLDDQGKEILRGKRSSNNCYLLNLNHQCSTITVDTVTDLWHQRLGHTSLSNLKKIIGTFSGYHLNSQIKDQ